jgi:hypothetical protein
LRFSTGGFSAIIGASKISKFSNTSVFGTYGITISGMGISAGASF